jgi:hypothetical protein
MSLFSKTYQLNNIVSLMKIQAFFNDKPERMENRRRYKTTSALARELDNAGF